MARKRRDKTRGARSEDVLDSAVPIANEGAGRQDWEAAEHSRPDLPDENEEGLDALEESMRHMAEDVPLGPLGDDAPALPFGGRGDRPVSKSPDIAGSEGDVPGLTDQGANEVEKEAPPKPRRR
jgi:hypothetical protein